MHRLLLSCLLFTIFWLAPFPIFASPDDLSPALSDLTKNFSEKFCTSIGKGMTPEKAGESAAVQLSKGVLFSPVMNEIISAPKEDLAASLSNNIFDECGNGLGGTKVELDNYLAQLVKKVPTKSNKSFRVAPMRQKSST